ncbi:MAG: hypothetical protein Q4C59_10400 [Lachnospiraceae bacterium]|nr:hypothetical protein [Lachnospiraceae bacterium]
MKRRLNKKVALLVLCYGCAAAMILWTGIFGGLQSLNYGTASFPYYQIGILLRSLSKKSAALDGLAWILWLGLSSLPSLYGLWRKRKGKWIEADGMLPVLSILLAGVLYLMVNPAYLYRVFSIDTTWNAVRMLESCLALTFDSFVVIYLVLRILKHTEIYQETYGLRYLKWIFWIAGLWLVCGMAGTVASMWTKTQETGWLIETEFDLEGQSGIFSGLEQWFDSLDVWKLIRTFAAVLPGMLCFGAVWRGQGILERMQKDLFEEEAVRRTADLASYCRSAVVASVIAAAAENVLTLFTMKQWEDRSVSLVFPLPELAVTILIMLLAQAFIRGRGWKEENEMFI